MVLGTLGLLALSALVWWVGPLLAIGEARPFDSVWVRGAVLAVLWALWIGHLAWGAHKRRRTNAALLQGLAGGPSASDKEAQILAKRFDEAVQRLKASSGTRWWGGGHSCTSCPGTCLWGRRARARPRR